MKSINGETVVALRLKAGFKTQQELAAAANIDASKLSRIENSKPVNLTLKTLERLADALKVDVGVLFTEQRSAAQEAARRKLHDDLHLLVDHAGYPPAEVAEGDDNRVNSSAKPGKSDEQATVSPQPERAGTAQLVKQEPASTTSEPTPSLSALSDAINAMQQATKAFKEATRFLRDVTAGAALAHPGRETPKTGTTKAAVGGRAGGNRRKNA